MSIKEQLAYLKGLTVTTGGLHEAQILQLRNYPLVLPNVSSAQTKIDTEGKLIQYDLKVERKFKKTKKFNDMCKAVTVWIRSIVWDDTAVVLIANKETVYDSRNE